VKRQFDDLTALRGIAALSVAAFHFHIDLNNKRLLAVDSYLNSGTFLVSKSYLFVDFFFILSGFILYYSYKRLFSDTIRVDRVVYFLGRRLGRLYPLHVVLLAAWLPFECSKFFIHSGSEAFSEPNSIQNLLLSFFLAQAWFPSGISWNTPSWSISAEWLVNFFFPWLIYPIARLRGLAACAVLLILLGIIGWYCEYVDPVAQLSANEDHPILRCLVEFSAGLCIGRIAETATAGPRTVTRRMPAVSGVAAALVAAFAILCLHLGLPDSVSVAAFAGLILIISMRTSNLPFLSSGPLVWLGERSYSIYLVHRMVCIIGAFIVDRFFGGAPLATWEAVACFAAVAVVTVAISMLTYRWIEVPARYSFYRTLDGLGNARSRRPAP
jgi:peptidoglycan/LPS O-acetylase OafA/YrhL